MTPRRAFTHRHIDAELLARAYRKCGYEAMALIASFTDDPKALDEMVELSGHLIWETYEYLCKEKRDRDLIAAIEQKDHAPATSRKTTSSKVLHLRRRMGTG